eukprot:6198673-Pleurochrysis_carterae.AAC.3
MLRSEDVKVETVFRREWRRRIRVLTGICVPIACCLVARRETQVADGWQCIRQAEENVCTVVSDALNSTEGGLDQSARIH